MKRLRCLPFAALALSAAAAAAPTRHLFLDPAFVSIAAGVALTVNPPLRSEVVIRRDRPWESFMITFYTSVIDEGGKLRLWYDTRESTAIAHLAYADSTDGVNWVKPALGIAEHAGSTANNLVGLASLEGNVFRDPHAQTEAERYVYVSTVFRGGGIYRHTSPDGLRWKRDPRPLLPFEGDTQNITLWDETLGSYVLFLRAWDRQHPRNQWRRVVRFATPRLDQPLPLVPNGRGSHPSDPKRDPFLTTELPVVFACDERDPADTDVYTSAILRYPLAPEWLVGFPAFYRHGNFSGQRNDGRTEVQFIASRDGLKWERYAREPYLRPGLAGSDSGNMVYIGAGMVIRGDEIWQFGTGYRTTHGDTKGRQAKADGAVFRHVHRIDGFVSLDFDAAGGRATTAPVTISGATLRLNLDTGALGELRVGLIDAKSGAAIAGFAAAECEPLQINSTGAVVTWKEGAGLGTLRGRDVRVEFSGARTKLYSFRFE
ncbi:MAG: hypothetical protein JNL39_01530 [Opitutaceae bacterium]|nr:hypothetical protein [Opitutaceae bacterium]